MSNAWEKMCKSAVIPLYLGFIPLFRAIYSAVILSGNLRQIVRKRLHLRMFSRRVDWAGRPILEKIDCYSSVPASRTNQAGLVQSAALRHGRPRT